MKRVGSWVARDKGKDRIVTDETGKAGDAPAAASSAAIATSSMSKSITTDGLNKLAPIAALSAPADIAVRGAYSSALLTAVSRNQKKEVKARLAQGDSPNTCDEQNNSCLHLACHFGNDKIAEALLKAGAACNVLNSAGHTPLHVAVGGGNRKLAAMLLKSDAKVDATDRDGNTPLLIAARKASPDVVELLLAEGANPTASNNERNTALHYAAAVGDASTLHRFLVTLKQQPDPTNGEGATPLMLAAANGHRRCVEALADAGANLKHEDRYGFTALHYSAIKAQRLCAESLIAMKVPLEATDLLGNTPLLKVRCACCAVCLPAYPCNA